MTEMSEVKLLRLQSGEEIICKVMDTQNGYTIKQPALLIPLGNQKLGLAPWLPYCETDTMTLPASTVFFAIDIKPELKNEYNTAFGSGLMVPEKSVKSASSLKLVSE
jgi:hypothetical protein